MTLEILDRLSAEELRVLARREKNGKAASRMFAIANALDGLNRADAARLAGMERQALRDAITRYNAEGLPGLQDRPRGRPPRKLTAEQEKALCEAVLAGPDPETDKCCTWTRADLCDWLERHYGKTYHPLSMGKLLKRLGFSRQKARPCHPKSDEAAREAFKKGGFVTR